MSSVTTGRPVRWVHDVEVADVGPVRVVRSGSVMAMTLDPVPITGGRARLGSWGTVELTGAASAVLRLTSAEDVELPEEVAEDLTGGVLLLNDDLGRLLYLPYAGELVVAYRLGDGAPAYQPIHVPRDPDHGLRMATVRVLPDLGALHLTESTLALYGEDCTPAWRLDENFAGWTVAGVTIDEVHLLAEDCTGMEQRQTRSLADGSR